MNLELLYALTAVTAPIVAKNAGMAIADGLSMGIASSFKKSIEEMKERADQSNNNIFYWQVASFLNTSSDIPIEEVTRFLEQHPQGYRLGAEVFKILESTYIEKQAELIAIAFKQRIRRVITDKQFNQYIHIITSLNHHIIEVLEADITTLKNTDYGLPTISRSEPSITLFFHRPIGNSRIDGYSNQALEPLGLIVEDIEQTKKNQNSAFSHKTFKRTPLYLDFFLDVYANCFLTAENL